jgi:hypothetical protein
VLPLEWWTRSHSWLKENISYINDCIRCLWQMTDPTSRQRGRPTETRQQLWENNLRTESNIWSQVPRVDSISWHTDWLTDRPTVNSNVISTSNVSIEPLPSNCVGLQIQAYKLIFVTPFYLQSMPVHSANCARTYTVACRRVLSSAPL